MSEQIQVQEPSRQGRRVIPTIFMIAGIVILAACIFILVTGVGTPHGPGSTNISGSGYSSTSIPELLFDLNALSAPSIPIGLMLFLIGLVNTTKNPSLRWLRITVSILCGILLGLAALWFLLVLLLIISGF